MDKKSSGKRMIIKSKILFFIAAMCYFFLPLIVQAQYWTNWTTGKRHTESANVVENANYIFEGIPKDYEYYYGPNLQKIYTSYKVEILHVYRGEGLKKGIIEVVGRGGEIRGDNQIRQYGRAILHADGVSKFIFFCNKNTYPLSATYKGFDNEKVCQFYKKENYKVLKSNEYRLGKPSWMGLYDIGFLNRAHLNEYFSGFENMMLYPVEVETKDDQEARNYLDSLFNHFELHDNLIDFSYPNVDENIIAYLRKVNRMILLEKIKHKYQHTRNPKILSFCIQVMRDILYHRELPTINQGIVEAVLKGNPYFGTTARLKGHYLLGDINILPQDFNKEALRIVEKYVQEGTKSMREQKSFYEKWKSRLSVGPEKEDVERLDTRMLKFAALSGRTEYIDTIRLFVKDTFSCQELFKIKYQNYANLSHIFGYACLARLGDKKATNFLMECTKSYLEKEEWPLDNRTGIIGCLLFTRNDKILQEILIPLLYNEQEMQEGEMRVTKGEKVLKAMENSVDIPFFLRNAYRSYYLTDEFKIWLKDNSHTIKFR